MGQRSYNRAEKTWIKEGRLPPPPDVDTNDAGTSSTLRKSRRPLLWKLAHEKKYPDGSWAIDQSSKKTLEVAQKIVSEIS